MTDDAEFMEALRQRLRGTTQAHLADELGLSPTYLSDVLLGRMEPGPTMLNALGFVKVVTYIKSDGPHANDKQNRIRHLNKALQRERARVPNPAMLDAMARSALEVARQQMDEYEARIGQLQVKIDRLEADLAEARKRLGWLEDHRDAG